MRTLISASFLAASLSLTACAVPDEEGTAADRAEVNNPDNKGDKPTKKPTKDGPVETASQENAREQAESYLDLSPFSREGLIKQLKFEDYSTKDATYAVDALDVDWNKQAAAQAESYLEQGSFSQQGLVDQLKFEGYTAKQAEYGAEQAYK